MLIKLRDATPFFRGWEGRLPGAIIDIPAALADTLIRRHVAKPYTKPREKRASNSRYTKHQLST